jgi:hypothetical protein
MPVRRVEGNGRREEVEGGIWRGIWFVWVGAAMGCMQKLVGWMKIAVDGLDRIGDFAYGLLKSDP